MKDREFLGGRLWYCRYIFMRIALRHRKLLRWSQYMFRRYAWCSVMFEQAIAEWVYCVLDLVNVVNVCWGGCHMLPKVVGHG